MIALPKLREVLKNTLTLAKELKNEKWANKLKNKEWTNNVFKQLNTIVLSQIEEVGYDKVKNEIRNIILGCHRIGGGGENVNNWRPAIPNFDIMVLWVFIPLCIVTAYYKFLSAVGGWIGGGGGELLQPSIDKLARNGIGSIPEPIVSPIGSGILPIPFLDKLAKDETLTPMVVSLIGLLGPTKEKTDTGKTDTLISSIICHMNKNNLVTGMGKKAKKKTKKAKKKAKKKTKKRQKKVKKKPKNQKAKKSKKRQKAKKPKKAKKSQKKES